VTARKATSEAARRACENCGYFLGASRQLERELPGLTILSSAYGDSMGDQGLCRLHERLVPSGHSCAEFEIRDSTDPGEGARS
jgi:hypothetical protein